MEEGSGLSKSVGVLRVKLALDDGIDSHKMGCLERAL